MGKYVLILILILFSNLLNAKTVYVSTGGQDDGNCATPKPTMNAGVACLASGDTLLVKPGTYSHPTIKVASGLGSWETATKIKAETNGTVTFTNGGSSCFLYGPCGQEPSWVIVEGFIWNGVTAGVAGGHHVRFINNEMKNNSEQLVQYSGSYHEFINNKVHDGGNTSSVSGGFCENTPGCGTPQEHGIYLTGHHHLVEGNEFYNIWGCGIHFWSDTINNDYNIVRYNYAHDNGVGIGCAGILLYHGSNNQIYGNISVRQKGGSGFAFTTGTNNLVYNNTTYANDHYGIHFVDFGSAAPATAFIKNNILWQNKTGPLRTFGTGMSAMYNLVTDPFFMNPNPVLASDFKLQVRSDSLAIDKGTKDIGNGVTITNFNGLAPDIGRWESGSSSAPAKPLPPQNVRVQ